MANEIEKCSFCSKYFTVGEHKLEMPGTKEREAVICPHCGKIVRESVTNGWWTTHKLTDELAKKYKENNIK